MSNEKEVWEQYQEGCITYDEYVVRCLSHGVEPRKEGEEMCAKG